MDRKGRKRTGCGDGAGVDAMVQSFNQLTITSLMLSSCSVSVICDLCL